MARNRQLAPGISRYTRSQIKAKRGLFKGLKTSTKPPTPETPPTIEKQIGGEKNGGKRVIPSAKAARFYPAEDVPKPKKSRKSPKPAKLRASITPGTVLILLAGRFAGKRVIFLKQLASGLLLVTGPYKINGVPLRRVNQAYVIATQTKIDLGDLKIDEKVDDAYFAKGKAKGSKSAEEEFFAEGKPKEKEPLPENKLSTQKDIDGAVVTAIKKEAILAKYIKATFGLSKGQLPHRLVF